MELLAFPGCHFCFGIGNVTRDIVAEFFECVRSLDAEIAAAIAVGINVGDAMRAQFVVVLLGPFGRAEESAFFSIPRAINDRALWFPAGLDEFAESSRFFH